MHTPKKCCVHVNIREGLQFNVADQWHQTDPISAWNYGTMWSIPDNIIPQLHPMGHVNNIPTMQCFTENSKNTQSNSYMLSLTECVWEFWNNALWDTHLHALLALILSMSHSMYLLSHCQSLSVWAGSLLLVWGTRLLVWGTPGHTEDSLLIFSSCPIIM